MTNKPEPKVPEILWKYRNWDDHAKAMIEFGEVYFARRDQLNDPMDLHWREKRPKTLRESREFTHQLAKSELRGATAKQRKMFAETWIHHMRDQSTFAVNGLVEAETLVTIGILCCSEINHDFLMWSHYSDRHKGICIGLRPSRFRRLFRKVVYRKDPPVLDYKAYATKDRAAFVEVSRTKSDRWDYEREWRSVGLPGATKIARVVDSVVFGLNTDEKTRQQVRKSIDRSGQPIKLLEIRKYRQLYKLEAVPIET